MCHDAIKGLYSLNSFYIQGPGIDGSMEKLKISSSKSNQKTNHAHLNKDSLIYEELLAITGYWNNEALANKN